MTVILRKLSGVRGRYERTMDFSNGSCVIRPLYANNTPSTAASGEPSELDVKEDTGVKVRAIPCPKNSDMGHPKLMAQPTSERSGPAARLYQSCGTGDSIGSMTFTSSR